MTSEGIFPRRFTEVDESIRQAHFHLRASDPRPSPEQISSRYRIDDTLTEPVPDFLAIVDDVLTTGTHFRAMSSLLDARFPKARILGLFIARRVSSEQAFEHWLEGMPRDGSG